MPTSERIPARRSTDVVQSIDRPFIQEHLSFYRSKAQIYPIVIENIFDACYILDQSLQNQEGQITHVGKFLLKQHHEQGVQAFIFTGASSAGKTTTAKTFAHLLQSEDIPVHEATFEYRVFDFRRQYLKDPHFLDARITEPYDLRHSFLDWPQSLKTYLIQTVMHDFDQAYTEAQSHAGVVIAQTPLVNEFDREFILHLGSRYAQTAYFVNIIRDPKKLPLRALRRDKIVNAEPEAVPEIISREMGTQFSQLRKHRPTSARYKKAAAQIGSQIQQRYRQSASANIAELSSQITDRLMNEFAAAHPDAIDHMKQRISIPPYEFHKVRRSDIEEIVKECAYIEQVLLECSIPAHHILEIMNSTVRTAFVAAGYMTVDEKFFLIT